MKSFDYVIKDEYGIHARPAGMLVKTVKTLDSAVTISVGDKSASADKLVAVMGLGIKCGDTVRVTVSGGDESKSKRIIKEFFETKL